MGWTRRQIVLKAFGATGLVEYDGTDMQPEMLEDGLSSLDAMLAQWDSQGIRLGAPLGGDLGDDSGLPDYANRAVYTNLAIELASSIGREVMPHIAGIASKSYDALLALFAGPIPHPMPSTLPVGAGYKGVYTGFSILDLTDDSEEGLDSGPDTVDSELDFS